MKTLSKLAAVCILVGAVLLAGPVFGFGTIAAERSVTVSTGSGPTAILGVDLGTETVEIRGDDPSVAIGTVSNNLDREATITTARIVSIGGNGVDDGLLAVQHPNPGTTTLGENGGEEALELTCTDDSSVGEQPVEFELGMRAGSVTVSDVTYTTTVEISCGKGKFSGAANFEADDIDTNQEELTQRFRVDIDALGSKGEAYIDLTDPQENGDVDYTGATVEVVSGQKADVITYDDDSNVITFLPQGNPKGTLEIEISNFDVSGDTGGTVTYSELVDGENGRTDGDTFSIVYVANQNGDTTTDGDVVVEDSDTAGNIDAGGDVTTGENTNVNGDITAEEDVSIGDSSVVGSIEADGSITIGDDVNVNGDLSAAGDVFVGENSNVGHVDAGGDVIVDPWAGVRSIDATGDVVLREGTMVDHDVVGRTVTVEDRVTVNGEIIETG